MYLFSILVCLVWGILGVPTTDHKDHKLYDKCKIIVRHFVLTVTCTSLILVSFVSRSLVSTASLKHPMPTSVIPNLERTILPVPSPNIPLSSALPSHSETASPEQCRQAECEHSCTTYTGSIECTCNTGYQLCDNRKSCLDIDECAIINGGCAHQCHNTHGSYYCGCSQGYILSDDKINCYPSPTNYPGIFTPNPPNFPYYYPPYYPYYYRPYRSTIGDDPHFAVLLPNGRLLCYSVQGEQGHIFNLISNPVLHINALFVPDTKRAEVTWIGSLGIVLHPTHGNKNVSLISFSIANSSVTITSCLGRVVGQVMTLSFKANHVSSLLLSKGQLSIIQRVGHAHRPTINVNLADEKLSFSVKFLSTHLDMFWHNVGEQADLSHGLIGQFFRPGVEVDVTRRIIIIPNKEPVPIKRRPVWSFMERKNVGGAKTNEECWMAMNPGYQGQGLIDGHYTNYMVDHLFSTDFSPAKVHHRLGN